MTHQLDLMPANLVDASVLTRIDAQLPKQREVKAPRLRLSDEGKRWRRDCRPDGISQSHWRKLWRERGER